MTLFTRRCRYRGSNLRPIFVVGLALVLVALLTPACGGPKGQTGGPPQARAGDPGAAEESTSPSRGVGRSDQEAPRAAEHSAFQRAVRTLRVHLDLLAMAHMADVDQGGLFIDVGSPARPKYTHGNWRSAWGPAAMDADRSYEPFGENATFWFHDDGVGARTLRIILRRRRATSVVAYVNGETLGTIPLRDGWQRYELAIAEGKLRRGENKLQLRAVGAGTSLSADLDVIHLLRDGERERHADDGAEEGGRREISETAPAAGEPSLFAPNYDRSQGTIRVGDGPEASRRAWSLDPGTTVQFIVEIPSRAQLSMGWASTGTGATATVEVHTDDGDAETLWTGALGARYDDRLLSLDRFAGKLVRLVFKTSGPSQAEVALSHPEILVPLPEKPRMAGEAKNVVVLTIDTLRASKLRPYNRRSRVQTPAFDAFAQTATLFEQAQAPENWTKPSVASILTALSPTTHGTKADASSLPAAALTLGEVYQGAGFATAAFLANGYVSDKFGFKQGWDHYTNYIRENRSTTAETVFGEALRWIRQHKDGRFFVYIQTIDPHVPYDPPDEFLRLYDSDPASYGGQIANRRTAQLLGDAKNGRLTFTAEDKRRLEALHDGEISYHDHYFGIFVEELKALDLFEDMVFVVTSDHGEEFEDHGSWGHGHSVYQELLHVPLAVRWPQADAAGTRVPVTVSTMAIAPTVLEATGVPIPDAFEGTSLVGYLRDQPSPGPAVAFSEFLEDRRVVRAGRYKLIVRGNHQSIFFDLESDPGERQELPQQGSRTLGLQYTRALLGQYLGARDRGNWLAASTEHSAAPRVLPSQTIEIDRETCEHLKVLGYHDGPC